MGLFDDPIAVQQYNPYAGILGAEAPLPEYDVSLEPVADFSKNLVMDAINSASDVGAMAFDPNLMYEFQQNPQAIADRLMALNMNVGLPTRALTVGRVSPNTLLAGGAPTKAELDPLGYGKVKAPKKVSESEAITSEAVEMLPQKNVTMEDLQGSLLFPLFGDQSATGLLLEGIDDVKFQKPVLLEGGAGFMRGASAKADDAVWASGKSVVSDIRNRVTRAAEETGLPVNMIYTAMGKDAIDFATFPSSALAEQIPLSKITAKGAKDFDDEMRKIDKDWVGVLSPNLRSYLENTKSDIRKAFVRNMDKAPAQKEGFPSVALTRAAVTDAELKDAIAGQTGFAIGRLNLENPIIENPTVPHSTYDTQMAGEYVGGLLDQLPKEMVFRDFYQALEGAKTASGKLQSPSMKDYTMRLTLPMQLVDQQLVDEAMEYSLLRGK